MIYYVIFTADVPIDGDEPDHINWIMDKSIERANEYKISGITYRLTQGQYPRDKSVERANEYKISGITYRLTQGQYPRDKYLE